VTRDAAPANAAATRFRIKRGLDIPIEGAPAQHIAAAPASRHVALLGGDYRGLKTALRVREGDRIRPGETLFTDRTREALRCTAPVGGRIVAIERGAHRKLDTLVIEVEEAEPVAFATHGAASLAGLAPAALAEQLLVSGLSCPPPTLCHTMCSSRLSIPSRWPLTPAS
jgi:Na+-transporting NADH:ubiquinone oxidoreductase subunit A